MSEIYIGIMSGTSLDGIDICISQFNDDYPKILYANDFAFEPELQQQIQEIINTQQVTLKHLGSLQHRLSKAYAVAVKQALQNSGIGAPDVCAIGCHGQTVCHKSEGSDPYSLQLGSGAILAELTAIPVVTDFRNNDVALGGQGAPLVPSFHESLITPGETATFINLGGIANVSLIEQNAVTGFDTGPANCLLDSWYKRHHKRHYDDRGYWASKGKVNNELLENMLADNYFAKKPPKSTGTEYFNLSWLNTYLAQLDTQLKPQDVQTTLVELTSKTVAKALPETSQNKLYFCGGGVHNHYLMNRLSDELGKGIETTENLGIDPDFMEALAFAWLAKCRLQNTPAIRATVTGAQKNAFAGCVYLPSP